MKKKKKIQILNLKSSKYYFLVFNMKTVDNISKQLFVVAYLESIENDGTADGFKPLDLENIGKYEFSQKWLEHIL